jgi:hypothetical protein
MIMTNLPTWISYLQALLTPAIGVLAVFISVMQWHTADQQKKIAHQRVILDLFDKRIETFDALNGTMSEVVRKGTASVEDVMSFARVASRARSLFGDEVIDYLQQTRTAMVRLRLAAAMTQTDDDAKRAAAADREAELMTALMDFYDNLWKLVQPYVRMQQKSRPS